MHFCTSCEAGMPHRDPAPEQGTAICQRIRNLPEMRPYPEPELTRLIGEVCCDYSTTRRELVMGTDFMVRENSIYELTELGAAIWRVEKFLQSHPGSLGPHVKPTC